MQNKLFLKAADMPDSLVHEAALVHRRPDILEDTESGFSLPFHVPA